jgi:hypothetical protein
MCSLFPVVAVVVAVHVMVVAVALDVPSYCKTFISPLAVSQLQLVPAVPVVVPDSHLPGLLGYQVTEAQS